MRFKGITLGILAACLLITPVASAGGDGAGVRAQPLAQAAAPVGSDRYTLHVEDKTGQVTVASAQGEALYHGNPADRDQDEVSKGIFKMQRNSQLLITFANAKNEIQSATSFVSVGENSIPVEQRDGRFIATYRFADEGFVIPLEYSLGPDYIDVAVQNENITEEKSNRLLTIAVLPFFGAGGLQDEGYMVVPDGSGALIGFNNGKASQGIYQQSVYGPDMSMTLTSDSKRTYAARLPVFGIRRNGRGLLAVITGGAPAAALKASVSGSNLAYNNVYCEFSYRQTDTVEMLSRTFYPKKVTLISAAAAAGQRFSLRYYFLEEDAADYAGMAGRYRRHLVEEDHIQPRPSDAVPFYMDVYGGAVTDWYILGIEFSRFRALTAFDEAASMLETLAARGVTDVRLRYIGWQKTGLENATVPDKAAPAGELGGKKGWERLMTVAGEHGAAVYPDVDFLSFAKGRWGASKTGSAIKGLSQRIVEQKTYDLATYKERDDRPVRYWINRQTMEKSFGTVTASFEKLPLARGLSLTSLGRTGYSDFSSDGASRMEQADAIGRLLGTLKEPALLDDANVYALGAAAAVTGVPLASSGFDITDRDIPFVQIVYSGLLPYAAPSMNLGGGSSDQLLKAVETGSGLLYAWMDADYDVLKNSAYTQLYGCRFADWAEEAAANQGKLQTALRPVAGQRIVGHTMLNGDVAKTDYDNGFSVIVNYGDAAFDINGKQVAARDYLVIGGDGQ